jgi:hypothetical protein
MWGVEGIDHLFYSSHSILVDCGLGVMLKLNWAIVKEVATGRLNLRASQRLFFIGVFYRVLDFLTSLFDLLPGFFYRLIDLFAGTLHGALFFLAAE